MKNARITASVDGGKKRCANRGSANNANLDFFFEPLLETEEGFRADRPGIEGSPIHR